MTSVIFAGSMPGAGDFILHKEKGILRRETPAELLPIPRGSSSGLEIE